MSEKIYQPYPVGNKSFALSHDCNFDDKEKVYICNKCGKRFSVPAPRTFFDEPTMFTTNELDCPIYECDNFPEVNVVCVEDDSRYRTKPKKCVVLQERRGGYVLVKDEQGNVSPLAINSLRVKEVL